MRDRIEKGAAAMGVALTAEGAASLVRLAGELRAWGKKINLTALLGDDARLVEELFLDSLSPLRVIKNMEGAEGLLDMGAGAGFPGLPLAVAAPNLFVTLADSIEKKSLFQRHAIRTLGLKNASAVTTRFEADGSSLLPRDHFDWATAKAVAEISVLGGWAYPHLKRGGRLICMKGPGEESVDLTGFAPPETVTYSLPFSGMQRVLYSYEKR